MGEPVTTPPKQKPSKYDYHILEMARSFEQSGTIILNPRDIGIQSLFLADADFRNDLYWHEQWVKYTRETHKQ